MFPPKPPTFPAQCITFSGFNFLNNSIVSSLFVKSTSLLDTLLEVFIADPTKPVPPVTKVSFILIHPFINFY